jgi:hypothetical protein
MRRPSINPKTWQYDSKGADFQISLLPPPQPFLQLAEINFLKSFPLIIKPTTGYMAGC